MRFLTAFILQYPSLVLTSAAKIRHCFVMAKCYAFLCINKQPKGEGYHANRNNSLIQFVLDFSAQFHNGENDKSDAN